MDWVDLTRCSRPLATYVAHRVDARCSHVTFLLLPFLSPTVNLSPTLIKALAFKLPGCHGAFAESTTVISNMYYSDSDYGDSDASTYSRVPLPDVSVQSQARQIPLPYSFREGHL